MRFFHVDAFTSVPFSGNPAVVCLLSEQRQDEWMQQVAREMGVSETAFVLRQGTQFSLRWFTPVTEVDLCGHATLASAHVLWESGELDAAERAQFLTRSGILTAERNKDLIELNFPALPQDPASAPRELLAILGVEPTYVGRFGERLLIQVADERTVRDLAPDTAAMKRIPGRGVVVTSRADGQEYDFVSRYFAPWVGLDEDPVTGSVHCCLGPFWARLLGKERLIAYQASRRGGVIHIRLLGERVCLGGNAVSVSSGRLCV